MKTWLIMPHRAGNHVHVQVRYGVAGRRPLLGTLVMDEEAWQAFCLLIENRAELAR